MDNLIYFSLPWLVRYDKFLQSSEYPHNKWFNLLNSGLYLDHITSRVHKLDTPWNLADTVCPIPEITNNELNFDRVIESIAEEFCQRIATTGRTPYICWSGGIDSTAILVSILKVASPDFLKNLIVLYSNNSIKENAYFYYNYIDKKIKTEDIDQFKITSENYDKIIIVDGEAGNQCMGQDSVQKLIYNQRYDLLDRPWKSIKDLSTLLLNAKKFNIQLIKESIPHAPIPIETGYDFLWWTNFNFKFDNVLIKKIPSYTADLTAQQTKIFWENSLYRFFAHPSMQIWSMVAKDVRREGLKITPKYVPKKYIYDFDHNDFWFYNKREELSTSNVLVTNIETPLSTPLFAIDNNWTKFYITNEHTRAQLGSMLQRI